MQIQSTEDLLHQEWERPSEWNRNTAREKAAYVLNEDEISNDHRCHDAA